MKRENGVYFTVENPFKYVGFFEWLKRIENFSDAVILEPFAGANNIVKSIRDLGIKNDWHCFDIRPQISVVSACQIIEQDTLRNFPKNYEVAITNPPYLAKNSATRRGLKYPDTHYPDLYLYALEKMLVNCHYVAAIVPDSFVKSGYFKDRLFNITSLPIKLFKDTEHPVCLATFVPKQQKEKTKIYVLDDFIDYLDNLQNFHKQMNRNSKWIFNDSTGEIGLVAIDNTKEPSIKFVKGEELINYKVSESSRSITRIGGVDKHEEIEKIICACNKILNQYRKKTGDIMLTSFKGIREDGKYRKRLDFQTARWILTEAERKVKNEEIEKNNR